ncbi:hypothetical protein VTH06DRAFT_1927 [Thermothelomyces fergusii]
MNGVRAVLEAGDSFGMDGYSCGASMVPNRVVEFWSQCRETSSFIFAGGAFVEPMTPGCSWARTGPGRSLLLGVAVLAGFLVFVAMDKGPRIARRGAGHEHGHGRGHGHGREHGCGEGRGSSSALVAKDRREAKSRKGEKKGNGKTGTSELAEKKKEAGHSVKMRGLLGMIADFPQNIADRHGHLLPRDPARGALLVQSGFFQRQAMGAQLVTAFGALLGTIIGIAEQELLETGPDKRAELRRMLVQFAAILAGAGIMLHGPASDGDGSGSARLNVDTRPPKVSVSEDRLSLAAL